MGWAGGLCKRDKQRYYYRVVPKIPGLWLPFISSDCACNQIVAINNRVLAQVDEPTSTGLARLRKSFYKFLPMYPIQPWSLEQSLESFADKRKALYLLAYKTLKERPASAKDFRISAFIKSEKTDPDAKTNPDARVIQARSPVANLALARFLRPIEHSVYATKDQYGLPIFAKGYGVFDRANIIRSKFVAVGPDCVCISIDLTRLDLHVRKVLLKLEHAYYKMRCPSHELARLLSFQLVNKGRTRKGVTYSVEGVRASGDFNTALGNCVLCMAMLLSVLSKYERSSPFGDGDDCLALLRAQDVVAFCEELIRVYVTYGQIVKVENRAKSPDEVVFCQSRMVEGPRGWQMVRDWRKVLSHGTSGTRHWNNPRMVPMMLTAVGSCELALNAGIPIIQSYATALRRNGGFLRGLKHLDVDPGLRIRVKQSLHLKDDELNEVYDSKPMTITTTARLSFERTFGVTVSEQQHIEHYLDKWQFDHAAHPYLAERDECWMTTTHPDLMIPTRW